MLCSCDPTDLKPKIESSSPESGNLDFMPSKNPRSPEAAQLTSEPACG